MNSNVRLTYVLLLVAAASVVEAQGDCPGTELRVGVSSGRPGETLDVEIRGGVSCESSGFSLGVGHDNAKLVFVGATPGEFLVTHAQDDLFFSVTEENELGYSVVAAVFDLSFPLTVPPTTIEGGTLLAVAQYTVQADAAAGDTALLNRTQTFGPPGSEVSNVFAGRPGEPPIEPTLVDGAVTILPIVEFERGEANGDGDVDVSDAVFALRYLFDGGVSPSCLKAVDANDSGLVDVSDPIYLLNHLFAGDVAPPPPYLECGSDGTSDSLTCEASACSV